MAGWFTARNGQLLALGLLVLACASCGDDSQSQAAPAPNSTSPAAAPSSSSPSASPPPTMSPEGWCMLVGPHLVAAQKQVDLFLEHSDGSHTDPAKLTEVVDTLLHDEAVAPPEFKPKIAAVRRPLDIYQRVLATGQNETISLEDYKSMSIDIIMSCGRYLPS